MKDPLNEGMARRAATEQNELSTLPQEVAAILNADNAAKTIGDFLEQQEQKGRWHAVMGQCLGYLHKHARANEDYIEATNQP